MLCHTQLHVLTMLVRQMDMYQLQQLYLILILSVPLNQRYQKMAVVMAYTTSPTLVYLHGWWLTVHAAWSYAYWTLLHDLKNGDFLFLTTRYKPLVLKITITVIKINSSPCNYLFLLNNFHPDSVAWVKSYFREINVATGNFAQLASYRPLFETNYQEMVCASKYLLAL